MYRVHLRKKAKKELNKIPPEFKKRIIASLLYLSQDPFIGEPLLGQFKGFYSLHLHPYRIIYTIYKNQLLVIIERIRHHKDAYK
ncbi:MAG: hypothetical protein COT34_01870 [Candidatus Nealsonbacteria bacterium CG08_land_8_20_14_0_20_43_11]|uniref:Type II toxin-antitoxin system mRNA interferase toxin, RelE/StbE family n=1 Tax=Candidatus Nealsonbacteria bacterium CG08_land_8_20_14_0_20_43_11 TaxID=1974706 RepID=A0A2M6T0C3_9BACT|nr:MAG: hypothetical protein COT34_01870 [Candidatus Nealsonbacteria bacterium CG08_land_8_20_14_0_20_43_11]